MEKKVAIQKGIELYLSGKSLMKSSAEASITYEALRRHLKKAGLVRSNKVNSRKYHLNEDFFKAIESEKQAYWLGFMYADGFLISSKSGQKSIGVSLGIKDLSQVEAFASALDCNYPIHQYQACSFGVNITYCRLLVTSSKLFEDLTKLGCIQRKSLILTFPTFKQVPLDLMHHFVRGYFDGDGSFAKHNDGFYQFKVCGTNNFLNKMLQILNFGESKLYKKRSCDKDHYYCSIGGVRQVKQIGDWMYKDATCYLDRKYQRYKSLGNQSPI